MNKYVLEDRKYLVDLATNLGFKNKSFLVTGSTGMIGKILMGVLLELTEPSKIVVVSKNLNNCKNTYGNTGVGFSTFDSMDSIAISLDYIIHLASPTNSKYLSENPVEVIDFIYDSTKKVLEFGKKNDSSVLYISSMEVYGEVLDDNKKQENELGYISLESTRSSYPESKRLCELLVKSYSQEYGLRCYTARLAQTFGAGTSLDDPRVFGYFARCVLNNEDIVLNTTGESYGNYCYIADTIAAFFYILSKGKSGECYNVVGDNTRMRIIDMAKMVAKEIAKDKISVVINVKNDGVYPKLTKLNMHNNLLKGLGWESNHTLLEMYRRMVRY